MPIETEDLLLRLNPMAPLQRMGGAPGGGDQSMERQRLKLMRQQFEETKRNNARDDELKRLEEAGRTTRQRLLNEQEAMKVKASADAKLLEQKQGAYAKFTELNGAGNIQGARAMIPMMDSMGMEVELEGEVNGLPRYRVYMDAAEKAQAEQAAQALGYPEDDSGRLDEPKPISSADPETLERFNTATSARDVGDMNPVRGPDAPDYTGSVPKNVIDTSAMQAQTAAMLNPTLSAIVGSYPDASGGDPDAYRRSAAATAQGVMSSPLPYDKSVELFKGLRTSPDSIITSGIQGQAQVDAAKQRNTAADRKEGFSYGETIGKAFKLEDVKSRRGDLAVAFQRLDNNKSGRTADKLDDYLAGASIARLMGERGATTEGDIGRALGDAAMSFIDQIKKGFFKAAMSGLTPDQIEALKGVLRDRASADQKIMYDFLGNVDEEMAHPETTPDVAQGLRRYRDTIVDKDIRDGYEKNKKGRRAPSTVKEGDVPPRVGARAGGSPAMAEAVASGYEGNADGEFDAELRRQADEAGLSYEGMRSSIGPESGGDPSAVNEKSGATGMIQIMPSIAEAMGTSTEEIGKMSRVEQIPIMVKYWKDRGLTKEDDPAKYYVALAAGGKRKGESRAFYIDQPDDTVVYEKGSPGWRDNVPWRPADGGDITVGSIKAYGAGGSTSAKQSRLEELRKKKAGG